MTGLHPKKKRKLIESGKCRKSQRTNEFIDCLLRKSKEHDGPVTIQDEVKDLVNITPTDRIKAEQEIQYQRVTHKRDFESRPLLYKVNKMSVEDMVLNLTTMFGEVEGTTDVFPTEDEIIMAKLIDNINNVPADDGLVDADYEPGDPIAIIWDGVIGKKVNRQWFIGFVLDKNSDGSFRVGNLQRSNRYHHDAWVKPRIPDIQDVVEEHILIIPIAGRWDYSGQKSVYMY